MCVWCILVGVGLVLEQELDAALVAVEAGAVEGRVALLVELVDVPACTAFLFVCWFVCI